MSTQGERDEGYAWTLWNGQIEHAQQEHEAGRPGDPDAVFIQGQGYRGYVSPRRVFRLRVTENNATGDITRVETFGPAVVPGTKVRVRKPVGQA